MKIVIGDKEISLKNKEVVLARKTINLFIDTIRNGSVKMNCPSLYFTYLIIMYKKSHELLDAMTPDALQIIMDLLTTVPEKSSEQDAQELLDALQATGD